MELVENKPCCVVTCENPIDQTYWDVQYQAQEDRWDIGTVAPPLRRLIDGLADKSLRILLPGAGNAHEAEYLLERGFTQVTVLDFAPTVVARLQERLAGKPIRVVLADFFEHTGEYDLIIEQTFFCALPPYLRPRYARKMHQLLAPAGKLAGLLFNVQFLHNPPFGGSKEEYERLFAHAFHLDKLEHCPDSVEKRADQELFFEFRKNAAAQVSLYHFEGITCNGCMETVSQKIAALPRALQASMSTDYSEVLVVSEEPLPLSLLQETIAYESKYKISLKF